jgi:Ca2+:H+ antiporter
MLLSVTAILIPSVLSATGEVEDGEKGILLLSRIVSVIMLGVYGLYLVFQLKTHSHLFEDDDNDDDEEEELPMFGLIPALMILCFITLFIAILSDILVDFIEEASDGLNMPPYFIGTILLPIAGNACEHAGALLFAYKNKMAVSLGIAIGSVVQVSALCISH